MEHVCQWPLGDDEYCGKVAHNFIETEEGESRQWFCAEHFDFVSALFHRIAEENAEWASLFSHLIKINKL